MFNVPFEYGSAWTPSDDADRARVAVISSDLNDKLFGGKDSGQDAAPEGQRRPDRGRAGAVAAISALL